MFDFVNVNIPQPNPKLSVCRRPLPSVAVFFPRSESDIGTVGIWKLPECPGEGDLERGAVRAMHYVQVRGPAQIN